MLDGRVEEACAELHGAESLVAAGTSSPEHTQVLFRLGRLYQSSGNPRRALPYLEAFMAMTREPVRTTTAASGSGGAPDAPEASAAGERAIACSVLAQCHETLGDAELAQTYLAQLVKLCQDAGQHDILADTCARLALAHSSKVAATHVVLCVCVWCCVCCVVCDSESQSPLPLRAKALSQWICTRRP